MQTLHGSHLLKILNFLLELVIRGPRSSLSPLSSTYPSSLFSLLSSLFSLLSLLSLLSSLSSLSSFSLSLSLFLSFSRKLGAYYIILHPNFEYERVATCIKMTAISTQKLKGSRGKSSEHGGASFMFNGIDQDGSQLGNPFYPFECPDHSRNCGGIFLQRILRSRVCSLLRLLNYQSFLVNMSIYASFRLVKFANRTSELHASVNLNGVVWK